MPDDQTDEDDEITRFDPEVPRRLSDEAARRCFKEAIDAVGPKEPTIH